MKLFSILLFSVSSVLILSCNKAEQEEKMLGHKALSIDSISIVYENYHDQTLLSTFDTQTVIIENYTDEVIIYGDWDTTIVSNISVPNTVEIIPSFEDTRCLDLTLLPELYRFGQIYKTQCWRETNGLPWLDSGVNKIISSKYGVISTKGAFSNLGSVIYSIDGETVPESVKEELISNND